MPRDTEDFDPTTLLEEEDHDEIETPEGEEEHDSDEGEESSDSESGDDSEQDETEEDEERADSLDSEELPQLNGRERRSRTSWQRREEKFRSELEVEKRRATDAAARLQTLEAERQREEAARIQRTNSEREDMLARMTPEERSNFEIQELRAQIQYDRQMAELRTWDATDKAQYEAVANSDTELGRICKKNAAIIEKHLTDLRARNTNMPRMVLLKYELGEQVLKALASKKPSKPQPTRKTPKATNSRGDAGRTPSRSNPSSEREARKKRLENVRL